MSRQRPITASLLESELRFATSRSSGPGGQNVNKVNSRVTLKFDVPNSRLLTDPEKAVILAKLRSRITAGGVLAISSQEKRSQAQNRDDTIRKFDQLVARAFVRPKSRKPTQPTKASRETRLKRKKQHGEKKRRRREPPGA